MLVLERFIDVSHIIFAPISQHSLAAAVTDRSKASMTECALNPPSLEFNRSLTVGATKNIGLVHAVMIGTVIV